MLDMARRINHAAQDAENLRIRLRADLKKRLDLLVAEKRTTLQSAISALVEFLLESDPVTQSLLLGQIGSDGDRSAVARFVLSKIAAGGKLKGIVKPPPEK